MKDFFVSYNSADRSWAEWVAWQLEEARYTTVLQAWDFRPGANFVLEMQRATTEAARTIAILSPNYLASHFTPSEWAAAFVQDPMSVKRVLLPIRVQECDTHGLLRTIVYIDLIGMDEEQARDALLSGINQERAKPKDAPQFPGTIAHTVAKPKHYPGHTRADAVERPMDLNLLPTSVAPMLIGVAIDVSGSMQTAIRNESSERQSRLESVLEALKDLISRYREKFHDSKYDKALAQIKLFIYGFGFADRAATGGDLLETIGSLFRENALPKPKRIFRGEVRDLFEFAGLTPTTLPPREIDDHWQEIEESFWDQQMDLGGLTHMRKALETINTRFLAEFSAHSGTPVSALLLVSDGESRDGSPLEVCKAIAKRGTVIMSCYLTSQDILEPKRLYSSSQSIWPSGARMLFNCSSPLTEDLAGLISELAKKDWQVKEGDRLFVQLNQSSHLAEFLSFALELLNQEQ